jgi:nitrite reductase/ring-hydroxylating ferredoxin subunit
MRFYPLEKFINLHDGYRRTFRIDEHQLLLIQENGERYLVEALCPHRGHPLETAAVERRTLLCPLHRYRFDLTDGRVDATEEPCRALRRYALVDRDTAVGVML